MTIKKRGRPPGPSGIRRQALGNPPPHIQARLVARMGKQDQRWGELLKNMDEHMRLFTVYRRKFRITEKAALTIIASINEAVEQEDLDNALASVRGWKKVSDAGLRARGYITPEWHITVNALLNPKRPTFREHTNRGIAEHVRGIEIRAGRKPPDERSVRRLIKKLKDSGAYL